MLSFFPLTKNEPSTTSKTRTEVHYVSLGDLHGLPELRETSWRRTRGKAICTGDEVLPSEHEVRCELVALLILHRPA